MTGLLHEQDRKHQAKGLMAPRCLVARAMLKYPKAVQFECTLHAQDRGLSAAKLVLIAAPGSVSAHELTSACHVPTPR